MTSDMTSDAWIITGPAVISSSLSYSHLYLLSLSHSFIYATPVYRHSKEPQHILSVRQLSHLCDVPVWVANHSLSHMPVRRAGQEQAQQEWGKIRP